MGQPSPKEAVIDVLYKYTRGLDTPDAGQLQSAFAEDAILDLTRYSAIGLEYPAIEGRDAIVDMCLKFIGVPLDTTHTLANFRVVLNDTQNEAKVDCYVEGQHFKKGQGLATGTKDHYLVKSKYDAVVVRKGGDWEIKRLDICPLWFQGTTSVLAG